jgi:mannose-6-phosphate isomerase-like protein (cupin superfamily)
MYLMSFPTLRTGGVLHVTADQGQVKWVSGDVYTIKATKASTDGSLAFVEAVVPPGGGPIAHAHRDTDESFYLLDGALEFLDGDRTFVAEAGDFVFVPRLHRHRFRNVGGTDARVLFVFTPGGLEDLFIEGGDDPVPGGRPEVWGIERNQQIADIIERTGSIPLPEQP